MTVTFTPIVVPPILINLPAIPVPPLVVQIPAITIQPPAVYLAPIMVQPPDVTIQDIYVTPEPLQVHLPSFSGEKLHSQSSFFIWAHLSQLLFPSYRFPLLQLTCLQSKGLPSLSFNLLSSLLPSRSPLPQSCLRP